MQVNKKKETLSMNDSNTDTSQDLATYDSDIENEFNNIKNTNSNQSKINPKPNSPKPIPKGIDFGEDLLGNPKFFQKNNQGNTNLFLGGNTSNNNNNNNSSNIQSNSNNSNDINEKPTLFKPSNLNGQWTRLDPPLSDEFDENLSNSGYSKDEVISNDYSESDHTRNKKVNNNERRVPQYNERMNPNISYNKYQDMTDYEIFSRKEEILLELEKLEEKGVRLDKKYNIQNDLYEMERTYMRLKNKKDQTAAMKLMKKVLMGLVSGTEYLNQKFNSNNIDLEGWSENVLLNIGDYDEIFEELYDKYKSKFAVAPEIKLFLTLIGSAFTFHMSKVLASKFSVENINPFESKQQFNKPANFNNNTNINSNSNMNFNNNTNVNNNNNKFNEKPILSTNTKKSVPSSKVLASMFDNSKKSNKNNDDLDEIIKEMENQYSTSTKKNNNKLDIPDENDSELNEILSDNDYEESFQLNEIQESINI